MENTMWFWIRYILLALVLIATAVYFLIKGADSFEFKETTNAAAQGLSRFYASIRDQVSINKDREKFVLDLDTPELSLDRALNQRTRIVEPMPDGWRGEKAPRRFQSGSTLKGVLELQAKNEGITLLWYLDKDFVVKDNFRIDSNFTSALYQVSRSINDDFENEVYAYFCPKQRAAVITVTPSEFVRYNCQSIRR